MINAHSETIDSLLRQVDETHPDYPCLLHITSMKPNKLKVNANKTDGNIHQTDDKSFSSYPTRQRCMPVR